MTRKLTDLLNAISQDEILLDSQTLGNLSDLNAREMAQFQTAWSDFSPTRRRELIAALFESAEVHIEHDFRTILSWTLEDIDPIIRVLSLEGLWEDERTYLIPKFKRLLQQDENEDVRAAAALALGRFVYFGETGDVDPDDAEEARQALWDSFHAPTESVSVRRRALEGISASGEPEVTRLIENALYQDSRHMRVSALYAMGRNADPRWIPFLMPELNHTDAEVRLEAVRSLGELEARPAVPRIIQLIAAETDREVLLAALTALGDIGGDEARKALEAATEWDDDVVVLAAESALEELAFHDGSAFDLINEVLGIEDEDFEADDEDYYYEDPLEAEIRQLLEEKDDWLE